MTNNDFVMFVVYTLAKVATIKLCKDWKLVRMVALVSLVCELSRFGMLVLPDAPVVTATDAALFVVPSVVLVCACGGSALAGLSLLGLPALVSMQRELRGQVLVFLVVALHAYAAAAGTVAETTNIVPSWDRRACVALALCGIGAGVFSASWANANVLCVMAYLLTCTLYLVQSRLGKQ